MANYTLVFNGTKASATEETELRVYANTNDEIYLCIKENDSISNHICLDRATAIKLHRTLKREISYLQSEEVQNG